MAVSGNPILPSTFGAEPSANTKRAIESVISAKMGLPDSSISLPLAQASNGSSGPPGPPGNRFEPITAISGTPSQPPNSEAEPSWFTKRAVESERSATAGCKDATHLPSLALTSGALPGLPGHQEKATLSRQPRKERMPQRQKDSNWLEAPSNSNSGALSDAPASVAAVDPVPVGSSAFPLLPLESGHSAGKSREELKGAETEVPLEILFSYAPTLNETTNEDVTRRIEPSTLADSALADGSNHSATSQLAHSSSSPNYWPKGGSSSGSRRTSQVTDSSPSAFFTPSASIHSSSSVPSTSSPAVVTPLPSSSLGHPTSLPGVGTGDEARHSYQPFKPGSGSESKADLESGGDTSDGVDEIGGLTPGTNDEASVTRETTPTHLLPGSFMQIGDKSQSVRGKGKIMVVMKSDASETTLLFLNSVGKGKSQKVKVRNSFLVHPNESASNLQEYLNLERSEPSNPHWARITRSAVEDPPTGSSETATPPFTVPGSTLPPKRILQHPAKRTPPSVDSSKAVDPAKAVNFQGLPSDIPTRTSTSSDMVEVVEMPPGTLSKPDLCVPAEPPSPEDDETSFAPTDPRFRPPPSGVSHYLDNIKRVHVVLAADLSASALPPSYAAVLVETAAEAMAMAAVAAEESKFNRRSAGRKETIIPSSLKHKKDQEVAIALIADLKVDQELDLADLNKASAERKELHARLDEALEENDGLEKECRREIMQRQSCTQSNEKLLKEKEELLEENKELLEEVKDLKADFNAQAVDNKRLANSLQLKDDACGALELNNKRLAYDLASALRHGDSLRLDAEAVPPLRAQVDLLVKELSSLNLKGESTMPNLEELSSLAAKNIALTVDNARLEKLLGDDEVLRMASEHHSLAARVAAADGDVLLLTAEVYRLQDEVEQGVTLTAEVDRLHDEVELGATRYFDLERRLEEAEEDKGVTDCRLVL